MNWNETIHAAFFLPLHRHVLNGLVQNEPGVLSCMSGILAGRGFNIDSLVVCRTETRNLSRMYIVFSSQDGVVEQACRQLEDLVRPRPRTPSSFLSFSRIGSTNTHASAHPGARVGRPGLHRDAHDPARTPRQSLSILSLEYLDDQLASGPSHEPRASHRAHTEQSKLDRGLALARQFEGSKSQSLSPLLPPYHLHRYRQSRWRRGT